MLRIPHCLDKRFTDSDEVVSFTHRRRSTPRKLCLFCLWYSVLLDSEQTPIASAAGRIITPGLETQTFLVVA
jgi:hypothetical protein